MVEERNSVDTEDGLGGEGGRGRRSLQIHGGKARGSREASSGAMIAIAPGSRAGEKHRIGHGALLSHEEGNTVHIYRNF